MTAESGERVLLRDCTYILASMEILKTGQPLWLRFRPLPKVEQDVDDTLAKKSFCCVLQSFREKVIHGETDRRPISR